MQAVTSILHNPRAKDSPLANFDFSLTDLTAILRILERNALALVATFPTEAVHLVQLAALLRAGGDQ
jgi:hypothetical protein